VKDKVQQSEHEKIYCKLGQMYEQLEKANEFSIKLLEEIVSLKGTLIEREREIGSLKNKKRPLYIFGPERDN
jgi:hypothetical protein